MTREEEIKDIERRIAALDRDYETAMHILREGSLVRRRRLELLLAHYQGDPTAAARLGSDWQVATGRSLPGSEKTEQPQ